MKSKPRDGFDDIKRGNVGTGDQGPGDVSPHDKIGAKTGQIKPRDLSEERGKASSAPRK